MPDDARLPDFEHPPLVETVMAVRFRELPDFTSARVGQFWERHLVKDLPGSEDRPPYAAPLERFGREGVALELQLRLSEVPPPTRSWFVGGNAVVQLQSDWFACNWRATDDDPGYIRYGPARARFAEWFGRLDSFVREVLQKPVMPIQCELTYLNDIALSEEDLSQGPLGNALLGAGPTAGEYLPRPEGAQVAWSYVMPERERAAGRLHVSASSVAAEPGPAGSVRLVLTARGRPAEESVPGVLAFLDRGHEWIVQGFKDLTTEAMWARWGLRGEDA